MKTTDAALLDTVADCLDAGDPLADALAKIAVAGGGAVAWTLAARRSARPDVPLAGALEASSVLDEGERRLFAAIGANPGALPLLRAVARRRRRRVERRAVVLRGLVAPFAVAALTAVLDPLPNLVTGGAYVWPAARGLLLLVAVAAAVVLGTGAVLRRPTARASALRVLAKLPGIRGLAAIHAEEELATLLTGADLAAPALGAAAAALDWSPLGACLGVAARSAPGLAGSSTRATAMGGLEPLARSLSLETNLAIVGGVAAGRLAERLSARGDALTAALTAHLRLVTRVVAYSLVVAFSVVSLAGMVARGLSAMPGMAGIPGMPGGSLSPDQKELEELMKQLEAP